MCEIESNLEKPNHVMSIFTKLSSLFHSVELQLTSWCFTPWKNKDHFGDESDQAVCVCAEYSTQLMHVANSRVSDCLLSWCKYIYIWAKMFHRLHIMWNSFGLVLREDIEWRYLWSVLVTLGQFWNHVLQARVRVHQIPRSQDCEKLGGGLGTRLRTLDLWMRLLVSEIC